MAKSKPAAKPQLKLSMAKAMPERVRLVELASVDADGDPYVVRCEAFDSIEAAKVMRRLSGATPKMGPKDDVAGVDSDKLPMVLEVARQLIERGTALAGPAGAFVRPAFWFDENVPRHDLSVDGRCLPATDVFVLGSVIAGLCGYGEGAALGGFRSSK